MIDGLETLQYPIGRFAWEDARIDGDRASWLQIIAQTPHEVRHVAADLDDGQLDTPYRPGGWSVRQVVHHYADDHLNSYVRFKLALTEEEPTIKPYREALWADLPDARQGPIEPSMALLAALHERWVAAWTALREPDWHRAFHHPQRGPVTLEHLACLYAWHGRHHVAQVRALRRRVGWIETQGSEVVG